MITFHARRRWLTGLALAALALGGCARYQSAVSGQQVTAEEVVSRTFKTGATPKVALDIFLGPVTVTAGAEGSVQATITKKANGNTQAEAEAALNEINLSFTEEKDGLRIVARPPQRKPFSGGIIAKLEVPAGASLELNTRLGPITVSGVHGDLRADTSQGTITVKDARGALQLTTSLGKIDVEAPSPQVTATNSQGAISVRGATGTLQLTTSLGKIEVDGPCTQLTAKNSQGAISVRGATGTLDLTTSLGKIEVDADGAAVDATNSQGDILIRGAKGRVKATTSLGKLDVDAQDALVDAQNAQGAVTFSGSLAAGSHSVKTTLGNVTLTLPAEASFLIDAQVTLGRISNAFPLKQTEEANARRLRGTVGDNPDATLTVNVSQGDVTIRQAK